MAFVVADVAEEGVVMRSYKSLVLAILVCELVGIVSGLWSMSEGMAWYRGLEKPVLNPPSWVFGPVWTVLYALMGGAVWLVWREKGWGRDVWLFGAHLLVNGLWSIVFFRWHALGWSLAVIALLCVMIGSLVWLFRGVRWAGWLLVPYLLWVSFATWLNWRIWMLN